MGGVLGPGTISDNEIVRFSGTSGQVIQGTGIIYGDDNVMTFPSGTKIGLGTTPSWDFDVRKDVDGGIGYRATNRNVASGAFSWLSLESDVATFWMTAHGSGRTLQRYGITLGGYLEITTVGAGPLGLILGTRTNIPIIFGTNDLERGQITGGGYWRMKHSSPTLQFEETNGAADENMQLRLINGNLHLQNQNDAFTSAQSIISFRKEQIIQVGSNVTQYNDMTRGIIISEGVAPTNTVTDQFGFYAGEDPGGYACPHFRTGAGKNIRLYQQAHIANANGTLADITSKFNTLLSYVENLRLFATS